MSINIKKLKESLTLNDYDKIGDEKFLKHKKEILNAAKKLKPYFKVSVLFNNKFQGYQYSPFDFTKEQFEVLKKKKDL